MSEDISCAQLAAKGEMPCPYCAGTGAISAVNVGFGGMLIISRETAKMTQQQLAAAVGISRSQIANIEAGRSAVPVEAVRKYAAALGVNPLSLLP